jgi:hypothetical protein
MDIARQVPASNVDRHELRPVDRHDH